MDDDKRKSTRRFVLKSVLEGETGHGAPSKEELVPFTQDRGLKVEQAGLEDVYEQVDVDKSNHERSAEDPAPRDVVKYGGVDDEDEDEDEEEDAVTEDIYSLLYTAPLFSSTMAFALFVSLLQLALLLLLLLNMIDISGEGNETNGASNRMDIPPGSEITVTAAQCVGMLVTVMVMATDGDSIKGMIRLTEGCDSAIQNLSPHATCLRWFITGIYQAAVGLLLLVVSFILTMQSKTVLDVTLNLTGLHFIQELDDIGFQLASMGFFSRQSQKDCEHASDLKQILPSAVQTRKRHVKKALIVLLTIALLVPCGLVVGRQNDGTFMCTNVFVQFGDSFENIVDLSFCSGIFEIQGNQFSDRKGGRPFCLKRNGTLVLAHCKDEKAWCFSNVTLNNACDYLIKSVETETFDVAQAAATPWIAKTAHGADSPMDFLALQCADCNEDQCEGQCSDNECKCGSTQLGLNCEFSFPECDYFKLDQRTTSNLGSIPGSSLFETVELTSLSGLSFMPTDEPPLTMRGRLLCINLYSNIVVPDQGDDNNWVEQFVTFTGRRWILWRYDITSTVRPLTAEEFCNILKEIGVGTNPTDTLKAFSWNKTFESYSPFFFSAPVDYGTESYYAGIEPSKVSWLMAKQHDGQTNSSTSHVLSALPDDESPLNAKLLCSQCKNDTLPCYNGGICAEGNCVCNPFFDGPRCSFPKFCVSDNDCFRGGTCNQWTNICRCPELEPDVFCAGALCQIPNEISDPFFCYSTECQNGGTCNVMEERCDCAAGFSGVFCETGVQCRTADLAPIV